MRLEHPHRQREAQGVVVDHEHVETHARPIGGPDGKLEGAWRTVGNMRGPRI
jgi:hypothetical protein